MTLQKIRCKMVRKKAASSIQSLKENDKEVVCGKAHERRLPFFCFQKSAFPAASLEQLASAFLTAMVDPAVAMVLCLFFTWVKFGK